MTTLDRQRSEFLGIAAHDLRSPLHKIGLSAELLAEGNLDEAGKKRFLDIILRSSNTMVHLLNDLLSITKIEFGRLDLKPQSVVLHDFLETILEESRELALKRGIQLSLTVADRSARVSLDPVRMEQVMTNLLSNAFKFSQRNTAVSVRANSDTGEAVIEVEDQGIAITPEDQKRLFTAFQESSNRPLHGEESTGLGLAICKKIVELHRGSIEVESTVGKGSLFRVRLPYHEVN